MKYPLLMRINHWFVGVLMIALLAVGMWMTSLPNDYPGKYDYYALHKSFGIIALLFIVFRISVRLRSNVPKLPHSITKRDAFLASAGVLLLYICMFSMPASGYLMSSFGGHPISLFGLNIPSIVPRNPELAITFNQIHGIAGNIFIAIIVFHILGTAKHIMVEKVNLINRIW